MVDAIATVGRRLRGLTHMVTNPEPIAALLDPAVGAAYGITLKDKLDLVARVFRNARAADSASSFYEQLTIVRAILVVPRDAEGVVAEFGCFKGASTASLSIACAMTGRKLVVFDSFEGLPEPAESVRNINDGKAVPYKAGDYCGTLDEVKSRVQRSGAIEACEFVKGFFDATLPRRDAKERYVVVFEDADLPSSVRDVLRNVWPRLRVGATFFCHEALDLEVVRIFYDDVWWKQVLGAQAPGFVGSGLGLPLGPSGSMLGYCVKHEG
jgi:O-methyltransferase